MIWPIIAAAAISAAGSAMGGHQSRGMAREANRINADMQTREFQFNAGQANADRAWNAEQSQIARDWNSDQAGVTRDWNAQQAQVSRDFEERMSNTQYQRATEDMKAAGLNPMLGYSQGGAGNVGGATASSNAPTTQAAQGSHASGSAGHRAQVGEFPNWLGQGMSSALQTYTSLIGAEQVEAQTAESKARTLGALAEVNRITSQTDLNSAQRAHMEQQVRQLTYGWDSGVFKEKLHAEADSARSQSMIDISRDKQEIEKTKQERTKTDYLRMEGPYRRGEMEYHEMLNNAFRGGASSASGLKDLILRGMGAARYFGGK